MIDTTTTTTTFKLCETIMTKTLLKISVLNLKEEHFEKNCSPRTGGVIVLILFSHSHLHDYNDDY